MSKYLVGSTIISIALLFIAWDKITVLNIEIGGLKVKLKTTKAKVDNFKKLAENQHKVIMANATIEKKEKKRLDDDYKKLEKLYGGSGSVLIP